jgi:hypothetical protein
MLGFTVLRRDASRIELLHVRSGTRFTFPLSGRKLSDKYAIAPDIAGEFTSPVKVEDHAVLENHVNLARLAADLHLLAEHVESPALPMLPAPSRMLPAPSDPGSSSAE